MLIEINSSMSRKELSDLCENTQTPFSNVY